MNGNAQAQGNDIHYPIFFKVSFSCVLAPPRCPECSCCCGPPAAADPGALPLPLQAPAQPAQAPATAAPQQLPPPLIVVTPPPQPSPLQITFLRIGKMHSDAFHKPPFCFVKHLNDRRGTRHAFSSQFNDQFFKFFNHSQCALVQAARYSHWQSFHGDEMLSRRRVNND